MRNWICVVTRIKQLIDNGVLAANNLKFFDEFINYLMFF